jgi:hypothetical protein
MRLTSKALKCSLAEACLLAASTYTPSASPAVTLSVAAQIANDMRGKNEAFPHGVPSSFDWASQPVVVMGNNANGEHAITAWGVVYQAAESAAPRNTRVNIRNMRTYFLEKSSNTWKLLQSTSTPVGAAYREDFAGDLNKAADLRLEPDGTISVTAGGGYNFHFYPATRAIIDPNDIGGIVTVFEARLITGDASKPDDRSAAHFLCGAGADYYPTLTGSWPGNESFNPGVALGKMKYVLSEWRSFAMTTLNDQQLDANPPPVNLNGILP